MSYPVIYAENATDFFNLGLGTLPDATKVEVTEERNGEFTLSMTYLVDGLRANEIKKNRIIKVDAGHVLKGQRFVIKKINKQLVDRKMQYQVYAEHVSYITNDLQLKPKVSVSGSGDAAIKAWRSNIIDVNPLVVDSDIETNTSTSWTIDKVQSARQALGGVTGSLLDLWGGEYRFDNYHISLKKQRGTVSNTLLSYGRNITDFDQEENITDTYTSVYPYATYTETTENSSDSESKLLTLTELTIDSKYVGNYPNRKILPVDLTAKFAAGEKPTEAKLREFAKSYVTANDIGVPKVSIKLSFVDLSQSSNYEALQLLEVLDLCDTVPVRFTKLGVDTKTKVSRVVWNVLADHYTSMELGDTRYTIGDMINNALNTANEANQNSQEAQNSANHAVLSADGHTMIFYGPGTPSAKNIGDLWYKPDGEYVIMYRWDGKVWSFVMSTRDTAEAKDAADKAAKEADEAKKQANKAVDGANDAVAQAGFANDTAEEAKSDAAAATQNATTALTNAGTALTNAKNALDNITKLDQTVKTEVTNINGQLAQKVNQTTFDTLKGTVISQGTAITQNKDAIKLKADTSLVNAIKQTVTNNTTAIDLNSKEIKLKASQSDVNKLSGRVDSAEAQIKVQADQIAQTVSKTELTTKLNGYATQTWTQGQIKTEADKINLSVSKVQSNLDGLQIGGTNYVRNGNLAFQSNNWRAWGASDGATRAINNAGIDWPANTPGLIKLIKPNKAGQFGYAQDGIAVTPSTTYTVSLLAQAAAGTEITIQTGDGSGDIWQRKAIKLSGGKERVYFTVTTSKTASKTNVYLGFNEGQIGTVWMSRIMMVAGNKPMDWAQNPADYASEVQFSQLQLTVNGIQGTVQDKADKSQVTQLANQITSTINNLGTQNFVYNPSFKNLSLSGWLNTNNWYVSDLNVSGYNGTYGAGVNLTNVGTAGKNSFMYMGSKHIPHTSVGDTFYFSAYIKIYGQTTADSYFFVDFATHNDENGSGRVEYRDSNQVTIANGTDKWLKLSGSFKITKPHKYISLSLYFSAHGVSSAHVMFSRPMLSYVQDAPFSDQGVSASEITQLNNLINLRVQKGDVINQINISPESILIAGQKVHITGQTSIDNAVIKDAMIANVKADKITAGTLNAANVNVINLNANNITTGTLKGANLSMNLNTGQVLFQKGYITSADGRIRFDLDSNYFRSLDYNNNGFEAKDGQFVWYSNWSGNTKNEIGRVMFDVLSEGNGGITIQGKTGASLITNQAGIYVGTGGLNDKPDGVGISGNAFFWGNLDVMGKKNAVHVTSKGVVETPAYETAESYLGDIGESITDEYGSALIHIDDLFNQIVNTDYDYQVFISSYSNAVVWVEKRNKTSFEVHSNISNAKFAWEIKAKRHGYETDRLVKSEMKYEQLNKLYEKKVSA
ncbi:phage tail spike protein [Latilactobacillus sakei]